MKLEDLSLRHKELLRGRLKNAGTFLSEYSFANLYLFRKPHDEQVLIDNQEILIIGKTYDGHRFVMPTKDIRTYDIDSFWCHGHGRGNRSSTCPWFHATGKWRPEGPSLDYLSGIVRGYDFIFPVPEEWLGAFDEKKFSREFSEDDSDYIYTVEKMETYSGPQLHAKKNLLNQFLSLYTPKALPLTRERMNDTLDILEAWQMDVGELKERTDYYPCLEAFELYDELILCGGIYYVNDEPAGFIIGEELSDTMFALHFAKGKRKYKGMYQYMYNHFAKILPKKYEVLNFEQDLGKLALKIAKSSYRPDKILKKYRVRVLK